MPQPTPPTPPRPSTLTHLPMLILTILFTLLPQTHPQVSYPPTWVSSDYIRAGNQNLFTVLTGSGVLNTYSFTFSSNLSGIPYLGYGIKAYQGNDYFGQERFQVSRIALNQASFTVAVELIGATNLYILNVPYIAVDPLFPHHVNSFDNVPVNYSAGPLVNVTVRNPTSLTHYTNTINYTQQASSTPHTHFSPPYSSNKILLFMSCMYITGTNEAQFAPSTDYNPLTLNVETEVLSNQTYRVNVSLGIKINLERLQYSMVVFDQQDVEDSGKYFLVGERMDFTDGGGFVPVPLEFVDNFIIGFTNFSSYRTLAAIHFQWNYATVNGVHGVLMPRSIGKSPVGNVISKIGFTIFYMKTWLCPTNTYINHTTNMCQKCPIEGCALCFSLKVCQVCDAANHYKPEGNICTRCDIDNNYYLNPTTLQCQHCPPHICPPPTLQKHLCNTVLLTFTPTPNFPINCSLTQISIPTPGLTLTNSEWTPDGKTLKIYADYTRDIVDGETVVVYLGERDRRVVMCDFVVPVMMYGQDQCLVEGVIGKVLAGGVVGSYVMLGLSIISVKIVGLELFGVLQLAYFALGSYSYLDIYLSPLSILKTTNGYNHPSLFQSPIPPNPLPYLQIQSTFLNNCNIMLLLLFLVILACGLFYLITKLTLNKVMEGKIVSFFKQATITLVMFNVYNVGYSTGVHFGYARDGMEGVVVEGVFGDGYWLGVGFIGAAMLVFGGVVVGFGFGDASQFGQFKDKFKQTWICLIYIPLSILYRLATVLYLSLQLPSQYSTLLILSLSLSFTLYFLINLPFLSWYQNYRAGLCHITQLIILLTCNYYRSMKSNTPMAIKYRLHSFAVVELVFVGVCVVVAAVVLGVEVWVWGRGVWGSRRKGKIEDSRRNTEASMVEFQAEIPSELKN